MSMKGKFVRWTATDEQGEFSYVGKCIGDSKTMMIILTNKGEMLIDKTDGKIEAARKPKNWMRSKDAAPVETPKAPKAPKDVKKTTAKKGRKGPTKISIAVDTLKDVDQSAVTRAQMIEMVQKALGLENNRPFAANITRDALKRIA